MPHSGKRDGSIAPRFFQTRHRQLRLALGFEVALHGWAAAPMPAMLQHPYTGAHRRSKPRPFLLPIAVWLAWLGERIIEWRNRVIRAALLDCGSLVPCHPTMIAVKSAFTYIGIAFCTRIGADL
jgi:hypothetical protein